MTDKPKECLHCKKCVSIIYKEIDQHHSKETAMCEDCPLLKKKLHGEENAETSLKLCDNYQGLCCSTCGTSIESLSAGHVGCSSCYNVFEHLILKNLEEKKLLPTKIQRNIHKNSAHPLHMGKCPYEEFASSLSMQMTDLHQALQEALQKENYEQAASLRDQINRLKESRDVEL